MDQHWINYELNARQRLSLNELAARLSDSPRTVMLLYLLAAKALGRHEGAAAALCGLTCTELAGTIALTPLKCSYEAIRQLLKNLVVQQILEFHRGLYVLVPSEIRNLRKLAHTVTAAAAPASLLEAPENSACLADGESANTETNQKAIRYFVEIAARSDSFLQFSIWQGLASCGTTTLSQLASAASGLAAALMRGERFPSPIDELKAIIAGKSAIKPASPAGFVFAHESAKRVITAAVTAAAEAARGDRALANMNAGFQALLNRQASQPPDTEHLQASEGADAPAPVPTDLARPEGKLLFLRRYDWAG